MHKGKVGFRIFEMDKCIEKEIINEYKKYSSSNIADAMGRFRVLDSRIRPKTSERRIVGRAITVLTRGIDNLMIHKALQMAEPDDIIVIDTYGETNASGWGGLLTHAAVRIGIQGIIIDGSVRDVEEIRDLDFPVFARAITGRGCYKDGPGEINCNISCGGVSISAGDLVVADTDGVAVVRYEDIHVVLEQVKELCSKEEKRQKEIEQGILFKSQIDEILMKKGVLESNHVK